MGFLAKLFRKKKPTSTLASATGSASAMREQLWRASPQSVCGVCGKPVRGLSGGLVMGSGPDAISAMLEGGRYVCPNCGFISCFECSADTSVYKVICRRCKTEMQRA